MTFIDKISLNREELANALGISESTLMRWESQEPDRLPPSVKIGRKRVYLVESLLSWLKAAEVQSKPPAELKTVLTESLTLRGRGRPRKVMAGAVV